jgi:hypothetical protein
MQGSYLVQIEGVEHLPVKPNCISGTFAELLSRSSGEQRRRQAIGGQAWVWICLVLIVELPDLTHVAHSVHASTDVAVLVGATNLQLDTLVIVHAPPVVGLEERVGKLGDGHAFAALHAQLDSGHELARSLKMRGQPTNRD